MRILGVDPGIARAGWGIIEINPPDGGSKLKVIKYGCLETDSKENVAQRLEKIYNGISELINKYKPEEMAVEELFFNTNAKTAFIVGQARGAIILAGAKSNILCFSYTPLQVKIAVSGYGRAEKNQVAQMVKTILSLKEIPKPDDTTDALAIAITHAFSRKSPK
ncbi:MAG: crossover junction endodeoxyribonuclease RuvC [Candidatus Levybacteria bacterium CG_4_9_14_3_um_filter_35_16]|nr:MAG: crossover junction endodeoxyribonuclease RuvC [Candidatus Levybacteria bacterium CG22_combo_CG10-13_8_21_14_all_35_11]PJA00176.1 MAG: crossover junction endodeoxyribonuclease RuvC [Candidatus Levybacteria bacterium CG_4_10_14_0_2_um_filter_35_8]PJA91305.1 MAG: crossover junction endodeoxyribonuclease RuvC [Candidatus Levybacteria bacterium CG_4_9_14_3_um_filter_35_16]PJC54249.1 MAG: crossover junction endodeoxyribonuclease RuvC [Candidatus Levybacteria bacterium CG_4_9_14_0_2_um_filter_3